MIKRKEGDKFIDPDTGNVYIVDTKEFDRICNLTPEEIKKEGYIFNPKTTGENFIPYDPWWDGFNMMK